MKKKIFFGLLLLVIVALAVAFYIFSLPPKEKLTDSFKEQAVGKLLGRKAQLNAIEEKKGNATFEGKYITFSYPARAEEYKYRDPSIAKNENQLEDFVFDIKSPRLHASATVVKNSSDINSVSDYPSVRLRENRLYEYKKAEVIVDGKKGNSYYKSGQQAEKSGFILSNGKIYSFLVSGSDEEEVAKLFDNIVSTAKIK